MSTALCRIFHSCQTGFPSSDLGRVTVSQNTTVQAHVQGFFTSNICYVLVGTDCRIFKLLSMGKKWKSLDLNMKFGVIHSCEVCNSSENKIGSWYASTSLILFMTLKNKEKIQHILNICKLILFLSFVSTFWWILFLILHLYLFGDLCYHQCNVIGAGTIDGTAPNQVSCKESYYHICILQLGVMADLQSSLTCIT